MNLFLRFGLEDVRLYYGNELVPKNWTSGYTGFVRQVMNNYWICIAEPEAYANRSNTTNSANTESLSPQCPPGEICVGMSGEISTRWKVGTRSALIAYYAFAVDNAKALIQDLEPLKLYTLTAAMGDRTTIYNR